MKYCTKCGYKLAQEARFCNACGAPVEVTQAQPTTPENPYAGTQPVYKVQPAPTFANEPKTEEQLRAEEQAVLDKYSLGLKHERLAWKISGIFFLIGSIFFIVLGLIFGIAAIGAYDLDSEDFAAFISVFATYMLIGVLIYLPIAIINLIMKNKLENYRNKLYTDCKDGIGHFSVGSIVFAAFFNTIALVFIIIYFIQTKTDKSVIDRIKANQDSYNSHM